MQAGLRVCLESLDASWIACLPGVHGCLMHLVPEGMAISAECVCARHSHLRACVLRT